MADIVPADGGELEALPEAKPLEGRLVEIFDMGGTLVKSLSVQDADAEPEELDLDLEKGRCVAWFEPEQKYIIETFSGVLAGIPEDNVREYIPPPPTEEGGFDLSWPAGAEATEYFGAQVCEELALKGYCYIQTFLSDTEKAECMEIAEEDERAFFRMKQEMEAAYMGFDNNTKVSNLEHDMPDVPVKDALDGCNRQMTTLGLLLAPLAPTNLGFTCHGRMNAMIRMSIDKNEEDDLPTESLKDMYDNTEWGAYVEAYVAFARQRKLSILTLIDNEGGDLWLYPKEEVSGLKVVHLPVSPNKILIFRHDMMDYSYQVNGRSLALQTWIMNDIGKQQKIKEMTVSLNVPGELGEIVVNPGPEVPDGPKASVLALTVRLPGEAWNPSQYWLMFCSGSDCVSQWPFARWETEPYYEEGCDTNLTGKAYTCHGGFQSQEQITQFDNEFFKIDYTEARSMLPGQKLVMEVGYQCFIAAGFNRKSLSNRRVGSWVGDVGPDWHSFQNEWGRFNMDISPTLMGTSMHNAITSARLAYEYNLKGPISSYDTACSASLVAMNAAHLLMFDTDPPKKDNSEAFVSGVNTLLGPGSFIGNCAATMLSHQGRSFTFNRSADGYQRGEGCGCIFIRLWEGDKTEELERVAALIGTATNQDGRSASLTAPNGPAQQQVIKKSMRFAGINPNTVSIAECHGTGTALGDPIEVGALMAVMHQREFPLLKTSAKSNICHLEAGAGIAGLTKCIMMINMATAPPNCHINIINPHLNFEGYPVHFDTEPIDTGFASLYCGVSSFGFGGTNSRADVYGFASKAHHRAIRVDMPVMSPPRVLPIGQSVYIIGTWCGSRSFEEMEGGRDGTYTCAVTLGESRLERFQLTCSEDLMEVIHPLVKNATPSDQIVGPDWESKGKHWVIDGRKDGVPAGTIYEITFTWTEDKKTIMWEPAGSSTDMKVLGNDYEHKFYLIGSWLKWEGRQEMLPDGDGGFTGTFKIRWSNKEEFYIIRDADEKQAIYPAIETASKPGIPICGPDDKGGKGSGKYFVVKGPQHQVVTVNMKMIDGKITVTARGVADRTWKSWDEWCVDPAQTFYLCGSFNDGRFTPMIPDDSTRGKHSYKMQLGAEGYATFQIAVNGEANLMMYPNEDNELCGPSTVEEANFSWSIEGVPYTTWQVMLDLTSKTVEWEPVDGLSALT
jgi:polyketide synthase-associated protein